MITGPMGSGPRGPGPLGSRLTGPWPQPRAYGTTGRPKSWNKCERRVQWVFKKISSCSMGVEPRRFLRLSCHCSDIGWQRAQGPRPRVQGPMGSGKRAGQWGSCAQGAVGPGPKSPESQKQKGYFKKPEVAGWAVTAVTESIMPSCRLHVQQEEKTTKG